MQPNTQILIVQKKYQINLAHPSFFGPSLFRPGPFGRTASSPGLQAQKPRPGPGKWPPRTGLFGPWGEPAAARRWMPSNGSQRVREEQNRRPAGRPPHEPYPYFSPPSLSPHPTAAAASGERQRRGALAGAERGSGAAELCSPEVRAAVAGAQLRRAWLAVP